MTMPPSSRKPAVCQELAIRRQLARACDSLSGGNQQKVVISKG